MKIQVKLINDKKIKMQEMEDLHSEVKELYAVRKQLNLMESTEQVKVRTGDLT